MPKKYGPKKRGYAKKKSTGRRRLQPGPIGGMVIAGGAKLIQKGFARFRKRRQDAATGYYNRARQNFRNRLENTDNITTAQPMVIGKPKPDSFQERVAKTIRPANLFKRCYAFSAESVSGRKAYFSMDVNLMNTNDLQADITTYKLTNTTDSGFVSGIMLPSGEGDGARFYVEKLVEKIRMMNSSTCSSTGKIHLIAHKRDSGSAYGQTASLINPINMLMYYSTVAPPAYVVGAGGEQTVGNGWVFTNSGTAITSYGASHNMPGSSLNAAGVCAITDPALSFSSAHVKDGWNFWFRKVGSKSFSLKPGQEFHTSFIFNDLPIVNREEQAQYNHIAGVTFSIVVEFEAQVVNDATVTTGDNRVSTGTTQISVIRESSRILGQKNTLKSKILLQTAPLATIASNQQIIINADTGDAQVSTYIDP